MRRQLVNRLREKGIKDTAVLAAIGRVPRHWFLDKAFEEWAYKDQAFPIGQEQTISQPFTVAYQSSLLQIRRREKVLEIGTGSGYQAVILSLLGARVYSVERQQRLFDRARKRLPAMGYEGIRLYLRDGMKGLPEHAPFEKILVTAGAREIPEALLEQLMIGGMLIIPVGPRQAQRMCQVKRVSEKRWEKTYFDQFRFVPLLGGINP